MTARRRIRGRRLFRRSNAPKRRSSTGEVVRGEESGGGADHDRRDSAGCASRSVTSLAMLSLLLEDDNGP
jgi:hypothetical protein